MPKLVTGPNRLDKNAVFNSRNLGLLLLLFFAALAAAYSILGIVSGVGGWSDGWLRWLESAYVLRGVNPFDVMTGAVAPLGDLGPLPMEGGTAPWAYLIGNIIAPGFLPWSIAKPFSIAVSLLFTLFAVWRVWRYAHTRLQGAQTLYTPAFIACLCALACLALFPWLSGLKQGNHSLVVTAALVVAMTLDVKKHWVPIALCLALASIKPHVAALFFLPYLVRRQWRVLLLSGGLIVLAWAVVSLRTGTSPIALLSAIFGQSDYYEGSNTPFVYYGLFDFLVWQNWVRSSHLLVVQMAAGLVATLLLCFKYRTADTGTLFAICAVISTLWSYGHTFDLQVLCLLSVALLLRAFTQAGTFAYSFGATAFAVLLALPVRQQWYNLSPLIPLVQRLLFIAALVWVLRAPQPPATVGAPAAAQSPTL